MSSHFSHARWKKKGFLIYPLYKVLVCFFYLTTAASHFHANTLLLSLLRLGYHHLDRKQVIRNKIFENERAYLKKVLIFNAERRREKREDINRYLQDTVVIASGDAVGVDTLRKRKGASEAAIATLDTYI